MCASPFVVSRLFPGSQIALELARPLLGFVRYIEVVELEELPDFDVSFGPLAVGIRCAAGPFDGFFPGLHLNQPVAGDDLLAFGKGTVHHRPLSSRKPDSSAFRRGLQTR